MLCTPILPQTKFAAHAAMREAASWADVVEVRLDAIADFDPENPTPFLRELLANRPRPVVLTFRPKSQGGASAATREIRLAFWGAALESDAEYFDIEYDLAPSLADFLNERPSVAERVIVSRHDFEGTPQDLPAWVASSFSKTARLVKIATLVRTSDDARRLVHLLHDSDGERRLIVVGMGAGGALTRILAPAYGALWTYSAAPDGTPTAPGQFSPQELRGVFDIGRISSATQVTGLIGKPVGHSISKHIHNAAFQNLGIDWTYVPVEVQSDDDDLRNFVRDFVHPKTRRTPWNVRGYSVTIPHKVSVMSLADALTPTARKIGAVNTLVVEANRLIGDNTDLQGAMSSLEKRMSLAGMRVAVLGAGGAARAVTCGLIERRAHVTIFARKLADAARLGDEFGAAWAPPDAFEGRDFDGLINATPVGMNGFRSAADGFFGERPNVSPVPAAKLAGLQWVYDLIYKPRMTKLLRDAQAHGVSTFDGLEMLVDQAARQLELWTGVAAPRSAMRRAAEAAVALPIGS
jgi:3-dehydroquinate dehydratase / shikimate dehydrogenase